MPTLMGIHASAQQYNHTVLRCPMVIYARANKVRLTESRCCFVQSCQSMPLDVQPRRRCRSSHIQNYTRSPCDRNIREFSAGRAKWESQITVIIGVFAKGVRYFLRSRYQS